MNVEQFSKNAEAFHKRLASLQETTRAMSWISPDLLPEASKELLATSNALQLAAEELYLQNEELIGRRFLLEKECQSYQDLFELGAEAYLITNAEGIIEAANLAACNLLNVSKQFLVGKPIINFISPEECQPLDGEIQISQWGKSRKLAVSRERKKQFSLCCGSRCCQEAG